MRFEVLHRKHYHYTAPVWLGPHLLRLRPRCDDGSRLLQHRLDICPAPAGTSLLLDADGNLVTRAWFAGPTRHLAVESRIQVETARANPRDFLSDAAPLDTPYAVPMYARLAPWIDVDDDAGDGVAALARDIAAVSADALGFVDRLNRHLFASFEREIRDTGAAQGPELTLRRRRGACRDLAVLFAAACRRRGLAARFVSGYQKGRDGAAASGRRWMHAWPEVYLPGAGWRGFDPTHGTPVADAHVALAAAARAEDAAPIEGSYAGEADSSMTVELRIDVDA